MLALLATWPAFTTVRAAGPVGYYRQPAIHGETIVFVAEGDLWKVSVNGGVATRLTSHPDEESTPAISPDGKTVGFIAAYEGPSEVYTMPLAGGLPVRRSYDGQRKSVAGFAPDGRLLYATAARSGLPALQLVLVDVSRADVADAGTLLPLAQAAEGCFDETGRILFFTRFMFQGSSTKRYKGGTAQDLWRYDGGDAEAVPLTADYPGTSKSPMWWAGRVYFLTDRDGTMNIWSMKPDGTDLKQHTRHVGWDVILPSLWDGRIAYQLGADLHVYDVRADADRKLEVTLDSDLDQTRENWVRRPGEYITSVHLAPDGGRVAITARGQVFVVPHPRSRLVRVTTQEAVRYRNARFMPDGKSVLALSDESGEVEFWKLPANGVGDGEQLTRDGDILRWEGVPSPDGKYIAHHDKGRRLYLYEVAAQKNRRIDQSRNDDFSGLAWSPDGQWLAYVVQADNLFKQIRLYSLKDDKTADVTTDRYDSYSPAWSRDGAWLYFLTDRNLRSVVASPWGNYQPEPFLDRKTELFALALKRDTVRSPFAPRDELHEDGKRRAAPRPRRPASRPATQPASRNAPATAPATQTAPALQIDPARRGEFLSILADVLRDPVKAVERYAEMEKSGIDLEGIQERLVRVPVPPGNYSSLSAGADALFWLSRVAGERGGASLQALEIKPDATVRTVAGGVSRYEISQDRKKLLVVRRQGEEAGPVQLYIVDAKAAPAGLADAQVDLSGWMLAVTPRQEWRQMFVEAWRLERDYFYDPGMHGVDWKAMLEKYRPLVDRVTSREELSDLLAQMVSELSALHIFVRGGDMRRGPDRIEPASLGAVLVRDERAGGYRVAHLYQSDPDEPERTGPLRRLEVDVREGDVIERVNGRPTLSVPDVGLLLRGQAGQQVLLRVKPPDAAAREVIVRPISEDAERELRYHEWEHTRRLMVEELGRGRIGYVHLRGMSGSNFTEWARDFYPVWNRQGLIIDVRNNTGGNIDSWILGRLLRKTWFYWGNRFGADPQPSMQYAFNGHVAVLCNERTFSDGEAFSEGVKRLRLGTVIGTRTWGGAIWLSFSNTLVDRGIASAAESGTYAPEGIWLIEGHGVEPDIVVDNLPHATFKGRDAQLEAAIRHLQKQIEEKPFVPATMPAFPDKSFKREGEPKPARENRENGTEQEN
ncbi:MAG: PD40 domain-containing protein [Phycisphaerae bacterium]